MIFIIISEVMRNSPQVKKEIEDTQPNYNQKIQQQYSTHKQIMKKLQVTSKAFSKISKCYFQIKTNVLAICETLQSQFFHGISFSAGKALLENISQINLSIADHCNEYHHQFQSIVSMYSELAKQKQQKYKEQRTNFNHYSEKIQVLCKATDKNRYERNKDKLKQAKTNYDKISNQYDNFLLRINEQAEKIWQKNFISFVSLFITKSHEAVHKAKQIIDNYNYQNDDTIILQDNEYQLGLSPATSFNENAQYEALADDIHKLLTKNKGKTEKTIVLKYFENKKMEQELENKNTNINIKGEQKIKQVNSLNMNFFSNNNFFNANANANTNTNANNYATTVPSQSNNKNMPTGNNNSMNIHVQKLFGMNSMKIEPISFSSLLNDDRAKINTKNRDIFQDKNRNKNLLTPKNDDFTIFENVFCQKSKSPVERPREKTPNLSKPVFTPLTVDKNRIDPKNSISNNLQSSSGGIAKKPKEEINLLDL